MSSNMPTNKPINGITLNWKIIAFAVGFTSVIPAIFGLFKLKEILNKHKLFIYLITIYSLIEIAGIFLIQINRGVLNTIIMNVFVLLDFISLYCILTIWNGRKLKYFDFLALFLFILLWIWDNLYLNKIYITNSIFRISYSLIICLKSIRLINREVMSLNQSFIRSPYFIIGSGLLILYLFKSIYETMYFINININKNTSYLAFGVLIFINFITNIFFTIAISCMEKKVKISSAY